MTPSTTDSPAVPSNNNEEQGSLPIDRLSVCALLYLILPTIIFILGWLKAPFALVMLFVSALGIQSAVAQNRTPWAAMPSRRWLKTLSLALLVASLWSIFGGAGHFLFANFDWLTRDAVLRDLTLTAWPPTYGSDGVFENILRAPVGYFLPAAVAGKLIGVEWADKALWLWTVFGVAIFLCLLPMDNRSGSRTLLVILAVVFFSGLDIVGWRIFSGAPPTPGQHLEWWARSFQYSSNSTQLFWVPNHAIPGWIAGALFFRHWRHSSFAGFAPMLLAALPLWSPFAAVGIFPFYLLLGARLVMQRDWRVFTISAFLPALGIFALTARYLTLDIGTVPARAVLPDSGSLWAFVYQYGLFVVLEFGLLSALLFRDAKTPIFVISILILLILPLFRMGPGNDVVMRSSIPALTMLCFFAVNQLQALPWSRPKMLGLLAVLALGALTPMQEFYRAVSEPRWPPQLEINLITASGGFLPPHYVARLNQPGLTWLMNPPKHVPSALSNQ